MTSLLLKFIFGPDISLKGRVTTSFSQHCPHLFSEVHHLADATLLPFSVLPSFDQAAPSVVRQHKFGPWGPVRLSFSFFPHPSHPPIVQQNTTLICRLFWISSSMQISSSAVCVWASLTQSSSSPTSLQSFFTNLHFMKGWAPSSVQSVAHNAPRV